MKTRLSLKPGQRGTGRLSAQYGDRPVCVRCRYEEEKKRRFRTAELTAEESDREPEVAEKAVHETTPLMACVRVRRGERVPEGKLGEAGGHRDRNRQLRIIPHEKVSELGTDPERVAGGPSAPDAEVCAYRCPHTDIYAFQVRIFRKHPYAYAF